MKSWSGLVLSGVEFSPFSHLTVRPISGGTGWLSRIGGLLRAPTVLIKYDKIHIQICVSHKYIAEAKCFL